MSLRSLAGNSPLLEVLHGTPRVETQQDAFAVLANGGLFYVGGINVQPALVTGVYRTPLGEWVFERSGSPDVVSDPSDPADLGDRLASVLLLAHGSALLNPYESPFEVADVEATHLLYAAAGDQLPFRRVRVDGSGDVERLASDFPSAAARVGDGPAAVVADSDGTGTITWLDSALGSGAGTAYPTTRGCADLAYVDGVGVLSVGGSSLILHGEDGSEVVLWDSFASAVHIARWPNRSGQFVVVDFGEGTVQAFSTDGTAGGTVRLEVYPSLAGAFAVLVLYTNRVLVGRTAAEGGGLWSLDGGVWQQVCDSAGASVRELVDGGSRIYAAFGSDLGWIDPADLSVFTPFHSAASDVSALAPFAEQ